MKSIVSLLSAAAAVAATLGASPAIASYICGDEVNVRGPLIGGAADIIGTAHYGEYVIRQGQSYRIFFEGRYRIFERVYFTDQPQGYGYVAREYICN